MKIYGDEEFVTFETGCDEDILTLRRFGNVFEEYCQSYDSDEQCDKRIVVPTPIFFTIAERSAWQQMDAAPKDGSRVLAWRAGWEEPSFVRWCENTRTKTAFWNDHVEMDHYENETLPPTHWLNVPATHSNGQMNLCQT